METKLLALTPWGGTYNWQLIGVTLPLFLLFILLCNDYGELLRGFQLFKTTSKTQEISVIILSETAFNMYSDDETLNSRRQIIK